VTDLLDLADVHLVVAMATFRRPDCLDRILPLLVEQVRDLGPRASALVVDNDPEGGAREQVESYPAERVRYVHEPEPGIAAARNRALDEAKDADLLVFIDDDETPSPQWLRTLLGTWVEHRCAAVAGPVEPVYEADIDDWIEATEVFTRRQRTTGTVLRGAATNNLLLDLRVLRRLGLRFDERFGITGGSDTMLTYRLTHEGEVIRWCDEATVCDIIPASRLSRDWILRRTTRTSNDWARVNLALADGPWDKARTRAVLAARGTYRFAAGFGRRTVGQATQRVDLQAVGSRDIASASGLVRGAFGGVIAEYTRG